MLEFLRPPSNTASALRNAVHVPSLPAGYERLNLMDARNLLDARRLDPLGAKQPGSSLVIDYLLTAAAEEVLDVLRQVETNRPGLLRKALAEYTAFSALDLASADDVRWRRSSATRCLAKEEEEEQGSTQEDLRGSNGKLRRHWQETVERRLSTKVEMRGHPPRIQFSLPEFYVMESETKVEVDIIRTEPLDRRSAVIFSTADITASAGENYVAVNEKIVFEPGERSHTVSVPILQTPHWNSLLHFRLQLSEEGGENVKLGPYLWHSRVYVIDIDVFPSSKFNSTAQDGFKIEHLLWEYCKLVWQIKRVWVGTLKGFAIVGFKTFAFLTKLLLRVYLVDSILNLHYDEENFPDFIHGRFMALMAMTASLLLLFGLTHYFDYSATTFGVGGSQRLLMQRSIMQKIMTMDDSYRHRYNCAAFVTLMTRDAPLVVSKGYNSMFSLAEQVGQFVAIITFFVLEVFVFGKNMKTIAVFPMLATPPCLLLFAACRGASTVSIIERRNQNQEELTDHVFDAYENLELISGYHSKGFFMERLEMKVNQFHKSRRLAKQWILNNEYFAPWLSQIFVCVYLVVGGLNVISGYTSLGIFLTNVRIIDDLGRIWSSVFRVYIDISRAGPSLWNVTQTLNLPTDAIRRMHLSRRSRALSAMMAQKYEAADNPYTSYDCMDILCCNLLLPASGIRLSGEINISQGEFVIVLGAHASGKAALLKTLAGRLLPDEAELNHFFTPPHLRVLHIDSAPLFFTGTLMDNLTFGVTRGDPGAAPERVKAICRQLHVDERIIELLGEEHTVPWKSRMSATEAVKLNIARAFIANPEILVVHRPTDTLLHHSSDAMLNAFAEFVKNRGLQQTESAVPQWYRQPRTCIISCSKESDVSYCDKVIYIDHNSHMYMKESEFFHSPRACDGPT